MLEKISNNRYNCYYYLFCQEGGFYRNHAATSMPANTKLLFYRMLKNKKRWTSNPRSLYNKIWHGAER